MTEGEVIWTEMGENTPSNKEHSLQYYGALSSILQIMYAHSNEWSEDEVICIIDEMISMQNTFEFLKYVFNNFSIKNSLHYFSKIAFYTLFYIIESIKDIACFCKF